MPHKRALMGTSLGGEPRVFYQRLDECQEQIESIFKIGLNLGLGNYSLPLHVYPIENTSQEHHYDSNTHWSI